LELAGIANTVFSIARGLQYFLKIGIGIGIGNTIMNIGSSFLLIPIVNTFMKQNGSGATAATYILGMARHKKGTHRKNSTSLKW